MRFFTEFVASTASIVRTGITGSWPQACARAVCRREDIKEGLAVLSDGQLDQLLTSLEARGLAKIYQDRHGVIALANATYKGFKEAKPLEYYKWFPG